MGQVYVTAEQAAEIRKEKLSKVTKELNNQKAKTKQVEEKAKKDKEKLNK